MPRIYTEIRISHTSEENKMKFEEKLDRIIDKLNRSSRGEWIKQIVDTEAKYHGVDVEGEEK
jgi:hypothetical protein